MEETKETKIYIYKLTILGKFVEEVLEVRELPKTYRSEKASRILNTCIFKKDLVGKINFGEKVIFFDEPNREEAINQIRMAVNAEIDKHLTMANKWKERMAGLNVVKSEKMT